MIKDKQCPLVDWYSFEDKCSIRTCKYYTPRLNSGCLGIDHNFSAGDKAITDSEILLYKFYGEDITARGVATLRKKTLNNVKNTMVLCKFIEYLEDTISDKDFVYIPGTHKSIDKALQKSPLRFKRIGYKQWMLPYITHPKIWSEFTNKINVDSKIKHSDIFLLRPKEHKDFVHAVQSL